LDKLDTKLTPYNKLEPKDQIVKSSYDTLLSKYKWQRAFKFLGPRLFVASILIVISFIVLTKFLNIPLVEPITAVLVVLTLGGLFLMTLGDREIFKKRQKQFFTIMYCYYRLSKYVGIEGLGSKKERKASIQACKELSEFVGDWVDVYAPESISKTSFSISKQIDQGLIPLIKQKDSESNKIKIFKDFLYDYAFRIYDSDPSLQDLEDLDIQLKNFTLLPEAESPKESPKFYQNLSTLKIIAVGGFVSTGLYFILEQSELGWGGALLGSLLTGFGLMAFLGTRKQKKSI